jgi:hypothetical protein
VRPIVHLLLHLAVPAAIAIFFYRRRFVAALAIMLSAMLIDLDHLLADPIYDPNRCSIAFHPLHTYPAIALYAALLVFRQTRLFGLGLAIHIALDLIDCGWMHLAP